MIAVCGEFQEKEVSPAGRVVWQTLIKVIF